MENGEFFEGGGPYGWQRPGITVGAAFAQGKPLWGPHASPAKRVAWGEEEQRNE